MALGYGARLPKRPCFLFDAINPKCYSGTGASFTELISGYTTTAVQNGNLNIVGNHLRFTPGAATRTNYIPFAVDIYTPSSTSGVKVPTGSTASWTWFQYFEDQGSIDHPNIGWETGSGWDGANGFVFGTGWGTDGPRWGIGGTAYTVYSESPTDYQTNVWQNWTVTFNGNETNGLKTYVNGVLVDQRTPTSKIITGVNTNNLHIGSTNSRGGNWGGYMDLVIMWNEILSADDVLKVYRMYKGRFGL